MQTKTLLLAAAGLFMALPTGAARAAADNYDFACARGKSWDITWDSWQGIMTIYTPAHNDDPSISLESGDIFKMSRMAVGRNPQETGTVTNFMWANGGGEAGPSSFSLGQAGPGYLGTSSSDKRRVVFFVDFAGTMYQGVASNLNDDQRFDGYLNDDKNLISGVTWWNGMPFAFTAEERSCYVPQETTKRYEVRLKTSGGKYLVIPTGFGNVTSTSSTAGTNEKMFLLDMNGGTLVAGDYIMLYRVDGNGNNHFVSVESGDTDDYLNTAQRPVQNGRSSESFRLDKPGSSAGSTIANGNVISLRARHERFLKPLDGKTVATSTSVGTTEKFTIQIVSGGVVQ